MTMARTTGVIFALPILVAVLALAGCGDDIESVRETAYEEGYEAAVFDVCRELRSVSDQVMSQLRSCEGL
jgi:hypothetical protein